MRFTLLLVTLLISSSTFLGQNADAILQYASELMAEGEFELALQQYELADDVDHGNAFAKIGMAEAHYRMKHYQDALDILDNVGPAGRYPRADYITGIIYFDTRRFQKALSYLENASPDIDPEVLYYQSVCEYELGRIDTAVSNFTSFIDSFPNHAYSHYYLGQCYLELDTLEAALMNAKKSIELDGKIPRFWRGVGDVEYAAGKLDAAIMNYSQSLALNPRYREARIRRGVAYLENGVFVLAKSDLEQADREIEGDELVLKSLLDCYYALNEYESFLRTVDALLNRDPGAVDLLFKRGYMHFANGQLESAIDDFEILANIYPEDNGIHHQLGNCYAKKLDYPSAIFHYKAALSASPTSDVTRYNLAVVLFDSGRNGEACEEWKHLIDNALDPQIKTNSEEYNTKNCQ